MAENKQQFKADLEEGLQGTNATSSEPKLISDQVNFRLVKAVVTAPDGSGSCSEVSCLWPPSDYDNYRCIYRVPCGLWRVNPEAYTPKMVLIGPLQHSKKTQVDELSKTDVRYLHYKKMEQHKKKYLDNISRSYGNQTVDEFRRIIKRDENIIRACYAESTDLINSEDFVEMMLHDSVFILVFFMHYGPVYMEQTGDFVLDEPCLQETILRDLILLENQIPYTLLERLFEPFYEKNKTHSTFRDIIIQGFGVRGKITRETKFRHFTDMCRLIHVQTLGLTEEEQKYVSNESLTFLHNVDKLASAGVDFKCSGEEPTSLVIKFEGGRLEMPCFIAQDGTEQLLRNIMALEQCHYPYATFVCDYISFLDHLIDTDQDINFLAGKGILINSLGRPEAVMEMINKLCLEILHTGSYYYEVAESLNNYSSSCLNRSLATLRRVYFKDFWTGTATITAVVLLVLTLIGTVASVLQVQKEDKKP